MGEKVLMKGNEVIGEAAIIAGCKHFFGYPITPQSELPAYLAKRLPKVGGVFLQSESEVAAINMVYGAAGAGIRTMTSSSSPGISLKQEGISYIAGAELPCLLVNIVRGGPGLGNISPSQEDYWQSTRGGGHGNYRTLVLAPNSVQEMAEMVVKGFDLADKYRNPVLIQGDGYLGQMMEPVDLDLLKSIVAPKVEKNWATDGCEGREPNIITSIQLQPEDMEKHNIHLVEKYEEIERNEVDYEEYMCEDATIIIVAYGITSRIAKTAIEKCRKRGVKVGLIRPKTLWPFPTEIIREYSNSDKIDAFISLELSMGMMIEDVKLAVNGKKPVKLINKMGGLVPSPFEVMQGVLAVNAEVGRN
jgi:2-oxoglutarate ferredoxin oxidoreductase subunit alpha